jgi:hypothetical protein
VRVRDATVAFFAAAAHLVAAAAMLLVLRHGLPPASGDARLEYMQLHRGLWTLGWMSWQLAAISLIAFYAVLALRFRGALSVAAMCLAAAGLSIDWVCETRYMLLTVDAEVDTLIGYAANGLYTIALALLVVAGFDELPRRARVVAAPIVGSGLGLAVASLLGADKTAIAASAILFPLLVVWLMMIGLWLRNERS